MDWLIIILSILIICSIFGLVMVVIFVHLARKGEDSEDIPDFKNDIIIMEIEDD